MTGYLLDTNVVSELRKGGRANATVVDWFAEVPEESLFISVLTVGELRRGIESIRRRDPDGASSLDGWLERLLDFHSDRILGIDRSIAQEWGRLNVPDPLPAIDGLLAATARVMRMVLVTRNVADVRGTGVELVDPFAPSTSVG